MKTHLLHLFAKLGVSDRASAVAAAYENGLLTPGRKTPKGDAFEIGPSP